MVFVNLFHAPLGRPMRYGTAKELFDRLAKKTQLNACPHMLRHGAATAWVRAGVDEDVVQDLMGHVSRSSLTPYRHASDADKRAAVELVAAGRHS
ncbi:tyrosine-type recombinase/integrase [Streptomyces sp. NPDC001515]